MALIGAERVILKLKKQNLLFHYLFIFFFFQNTWEGSEFKNNLVY